MASVQHHSESIAAQPSVTATFANFAMPSLLESSSKSKTWVYTTVALILALLALEQTVYRYKKSHLPGAKWTIPIIGKFADSLNPTMEGYKKQWASGALSAISVFNMCVHF
jgi:C-22 sterol desaturase